MTSRPLIMRRCEDCGFTLTTPYRRCCPKCGGWMLTLPIDEAPDLTSAAARIRQATTTAAYLAAVKTG